jgi:ubiquinone/menaquinone biosynthesis C-methylase UbiE
VRRLDRAALAAAGAVRFRSEYDYAVFEYLRSAKVLEALSRAGVEPGGRVLDAGCGSGGTALSLADEPSAPFVVGLDLEARFRGSGTRLAAEKGLSGRAVFAQGDATRLPFAAGSFDLVLSHSVIEHVAAAERYVAECHRVLRPGGVLYLATQPFLSFAGSHLPRLKVPVPVHLLVGRRAAFALFCWLARHAPGTLRERKEANTFIALAERGEKKTDDLRQHVTVSRLRRWVQEAGFRVVSEERQLTGFFRAAFPGPLRRGLEAVPWARDVAISQVECVLVKP